MRKRIWMWIGLPIAIAVIGFSAWALTSPSDFRRDFAPLTTRVKLTVIIEFQGAQYTGSSVQEFTVRRGGDLVSEGMNLVGYRGQALQVGLPDGGLIAVLVNSHSGNDRSLFSSTMSCIREDIGGKWNNAKERWDALEQFSGPCLLTLSSVPRTLLIPQRSSPNGMEIIWQHDAARDEPRLVEAVLQRSEEPLSEGIAADLPWLNDLATPYLAVPVRGGGVSQVGIGDFTIQFQREGM